MTSTNPRTMVPIPKIDGHKVVPGVPFGEGSVLAVGEGSGGWLTTVL